MRRENLSNRFSCLLHGNREPAVRIVRGAVLITVPQLLASMHVPQPLIASITAAAMIPTFCGFLLAPILDVRFSRRSYALVFGAYGARRWLGLLSVATRATWPYTWWPDSCSPICSTTRSAAGSATSSPPGDEGRLGASFTIGNVVGFGIGAILHQL